MKKLLKLALVALGLAAVLSGCNQESSSDSSNSSLLVLASKAGNAAKKLPAPVGENPFLNKRFQTDSGYSTCTWEFSKDKLIITQEDEEDILGINFIIEYSYTWDTNKKLFAYKPVRLRDFENPAKKYSISQYYNKAAAAIYQNLIEQAKKEYAGDDWENEGLQEFLQKCGSQLGLPETPTEKQLIAIFEEAAKEMTSDIYLTTVFFNYEPDGDDIKLSLYTEPNLKLKDYFYNYQLPDFNGTDDNSYSELVMSHLYFYPLRNLTITGITDSIIFARSDEDLERYELPYTETADEDGIINEFVITYEDHNYGFRRDKGSLRLEYFPNVQ